ncbi:MAG: M16 family metallopeptidase [Candidatus Paceibacteria bacterium]
MQFSKKKLKNGLTVLTVPMQDNPTATVLVLVETGSKYETKRLNGISHFLEHMCFKGTVKRPKAIDIVRELDALGSQYNAFTAQEFTGYYAKAEARHFKQIFDVVSDIYLNSTFPEVEIEKEKGVIVEEINMYEDTPSRHVQDLIMELLYGNQPAGWNIAGTRENVKKMKRKDFVAYHALHYVPGATTLVVAGQVSEHDVLKEAERIFGSIPNGTKGTKQKVKEKQAKPAMLIKYKKTDQSHFVLAFRSFDLFSKKNAALSVLGGILGGGMSSRLFQKLREEMGVGYYVRAYEDAYTDHGFFQVSAGVDNKRVTEVLEAVLSECKKLATELVPEDELKKVQDYIVGNMKLDLESSDSIAHFHGLQDVLKKDIKTMDDKAREIYQVTSQEVLEVAKDIFKDKNMNLALIGPVKNKNPINKILKL